MKYNASLVFLMIAGCGGGSGEGPTDVSNAGQAPSAPQETIAASPSPTTVPAPVPTVSPVPPRTAPAPLQAGSPQPSPVPTVPSPSEQAPTIKGSVLSLALGAWLAPEANDPKTVGQGVLGDVHIQQRTFSNPQTAGSYSMTVQSHGFSQSILPVTITASRVFTDSGARSVSDVGITDVGTLLPEPYFYQDTDDITLDTVLNEWTAQGNQGWYARLSVENYGPDFKLCWSFKIPAVTRMACSVFNKKTAEHQGIYVTEGNKVWETIGVSE